MNIAMEYFQNKQIIAIIFLKRANQNKIIDAKSLNYSLFSIFYFIKYLAILFNGFNINFFSYLFMLINHIDMM